MSAASEPYRFVPPATDPTQPTLTGSFGMSASTHWLATATSQSVLERGGNAFDAATAAGFVLHVVEPHLNGPGGDMVALISEPTAASPEVLMGQGPAPRRATIEHYRAEGLTLVPGSGALAAAVPAAVEAWLWLLEYKGTWSLADVLAYAIHYAEVGHAISPQAAGVIATMAAHFDEHWPTSAALWSPNSAAPAVGDVITNPAYGATLRRLVAAGDDIPESRADRREARIQAARKAWKSGFVATAIVDFAAIPHRHSTGSDHAGVIGLDDFANFEFTTEPPVTLEFRGVTVTKSDRWGQGPVLLQALAILDQFGDEHLDPSTALGAHTIIEAIKLAMADRDAYYGDASGDLMAASDGKPTVLQRLLDPEYSRQRASLISDTASLEFRPGHLDGITAYIPPLDIHDPEGATRVAPAGVGEPTVGSSGVTRGDTSHLDVVDSKGNMVSATPSGGWLQSSPTIPELGFCLGTRLQMTWLDESSPSALRPGTRPRTTLTPTMLQRDGVTVAALGTPGGDQQDQTQLLFLLRTLVGGYTQQQAIDAPAFHSTSLSGSFWPRTFTPGGLVIESRLGSTVIDELIERGHVVTVVNGWSLGRMSSVERDPATGQLSAAANPRGNQGYAAGR